MDEKTCPVDQDTERQAIASYAGTSQAEVDTALQLLHPIEILASAAKTRKAHLRKEIQVRPDI